MFGSGPRIGVLAVWLLDSYAQTVASGVIDVAGRQGASVLTFLAGRSHTTHPNDRASRLALELITPAVVDGLIVMAGPMVESADQLEELCARFAPMHIVTIAVPARGAG